MVAMTGMGDGTGVSLRNPTIVSAFHHQLWIGLVVVLVVAAFTPLAVNVAAPYWTRAQRWVLSASRRLTVSWRPAAIQGSTTGDDEALGRRVLRIGFGLIWLADGLLQLQPAMPMGLADQVTVPSAFGSPAWLQHLVRTGAGIWNDHPVEAAAAAAWIQIAIGIWLLTARRGRISRLGGVVGFGWAAVVWVFGEAMGGVLAPGLSWAFGAPGAVLFYAAAGVLIALPPRLWRGDRLGRMLLMVMGAFLMGMALLQAWPGRGFWRGRGGDISQMVSAMASGAQPRALSSMLQAFAGFDQAHGFVVNLVLVSALAVVGIAFVSGRPGAVRPALWGFIVLCLADWLLVQDLGVLGGLGTDPNSALPQLLLVISGYVAMVLPALPTPADAPLASTSPGARALGKTPSPATVPALAMTSPTAPPTTSGVPIGTSRPALRPRQLPRVLLAGATVCMLALGVVPMTTAALASTPDSVLAAAVDGTPSVLSGQAPSFSLVDQEGHDVSLHDLRGKALLLTFLDPVCTSTCPLIAQQLREASNLLGHDASRVELVAIASNPIFHSVADVEAFTRQEQLGNLPNWLFLTGSLGTLESVWKAYGIEVTVTPAGAMVSHSVVVYVVGPHGNLRWVDPENPTDPFVAAAASSPTAQDLSFSGVLAGNVRSVLSER
ncbi:MAG: SCO family protein [Actinomycetota bacterium]|nr:SCO family protein [Actinomycetota bacterium]